MSEQIGGGDRPRGGSGQQHKQGVEIRGAGWGWGRPQVSAEQRGGQEQGGELEGCRATAPL